MDCQKSGNRQKIKRKVTPAYIEEKVLGVEINMLPILLGLKPEAESHDELIYVIKTYLFGIFRKKLYLYLENKIVIDYYIDYYD